MRIVQLLVCVLFLVATISAQCLTCIIQRDSLSQHEKLDTCRIVIKIERYNDMFVYPAEYDTVRAFWRTDKSVYARKKDVEFLYPNNCYNVNVVGIIK